jgi:hypothetical protein
VRRFLVKFLDPDRYCPCGRERGVGACRIVNRRTGETTGLYWAVACPEIHLSFHADGSASWTPHQGHSHDIGCWEPSWIPAPMRAEIAAEAGDYGFTSRTVTTWQSKGEDR